MSYNELHEHKRSDTVKWIVAFALIAVLFAGMIGGFFVITKNVETPEEDPNSEVVTPVTPPEENVALMSMEAKPMLSLLASPDVVKSVSAKGVVTVSKTITATVLPIDAPDKSVDWSIEWCIPIEGADISEYLTITPQSDGALTCTVTAHQGFEGASAYVTATTRVGGYSAQCLVMFEGAPESLSFVCNGREYGTSDTIKMIAGSTYSVSLKLNNQLNAIGSRYGDFEITSMRGQGKFVMTKEYIINGSIRSSEDIIFDLEQGSYTYTNEVSNKQETLTITPTSFFTPTIAGDKLNIDVFRSESSYANGYPRTGYRFKYKSAYTDPRSGGVPTNCTWYLVVRDKVSGKEALINIDIESTVNNIALSTSTLSF